MINKPIVTMLVILMLLPSLLWAGWNTPDCGYFNHQKDIDKTVSDFSQSAATIAFGGKLYNFIDYLVDLGYGKIIVRELTNNGEAGSIKWKSVKYDSITALQGLSEWSFQPAPVVFHDQLILFVIDKDEDLAFSKYMPETNSWSGLTKTPISYGAPYYMAAVVIGKKLCLISKHYLFSIDSTTYNLNIVLSSTEDLVKWENTPTSIEVGASFPEVSAVTQTYMKGNALEEKLLVGYLDDSNHARCAEFDLDLDSGKFTEIVDKSIASDQEYRSVALAVGSVAGDPSTGNMVQAFLKKKALDNGYQRFRILRYQSIADENGASGDWTKQENNLVKQNYLWASRHVNLTAVNFPVTDGKTIRQYMCLIYRGYDDWDHPLNCAWVETDSLKQVGDARQQTLTNPENVQYIGYIEGPPPFYLNNEKKLPAPLNGPTAEWISRAEFSHEDLAATDRNTKFTVGLKLAGEFKGFKGSLSGEYEHGKDVTKTTTIRHTIDLHPTDEPTGYYITLQPVINRADYLVHDVHGTPLYTTYYFWMSSPHLLNEPVPGLADSRLNPGLPGTYMNRGINFDSFSSFADTANADVSWASGSGSSVSLKVTEETKITNTGKVEIELGYKAGEEHVWEVDAELSGSLEYEVTTTTESGNEVTCATDLNEPVEGTDLNALAYTVRWIKPTEGNDNWWLYPGQDPEQQTWCLTYEVYYMQTKAGDEYFPGD